MPRSDWSNPIVQTTIDQLKWIKRYPMERKVTLIVGHCSNGDSARTESAGLCRGNEFRLRFLVLGIGPSP
ncbi:hypothetical protein X946_5110 [Burkholderia sp. ABCPW 111]|nr:hypothetical protein X946_5110 [Burkholderia sp. ABCPW 111]